MEEENLLRLLRLLEDAFGYLPIPPASRVAYSHFRDDLESQEVQAKFQGQHWRDLRPKDLAGEESSLSFFTPEAFRFFLPAFIRGSLLEPNNIDLLDAILRNLAQPDDSSIWKNRKSAYLATARKHSIPEEVVLELAPNHSPDLDAFCKERVATLSEDQKEAVINFVRYMKQRTIYDQFLERHLDRAESELEAWKR